jgi:hypothetical protein
MAGACWNKIASSDSFLSDAHGKIAVGWEYYLAAAIILNFPPTGSYDERECWRVAFPPAQMLEVRDTKILR